MRILLLLLLVFFAVPARAETAFDRIMKTQTIRCGYVVTEAVQKDPNTGTIQGIVPDIMAEAGRLLNLKIEWAEELNWANYVEAISSGRVDAICTNFWMEPNGSKVVGYTVPFYYSGVGIFVRKDDKRFDNHIAAIDDPNVRVSGMEGEISAMIAEQDFPKAQKVMISQMGDGSQLLMELVSGKADIAFVDVAIARRFDHSNPDKIRNIVPEAPIRIFANTIALPPEDVRLKTMLDATLSQMLYGGFIEKVLKKHIGVAEGYYNVAKPYGEIVK